ncbi:MAG: glycosyl hydrolase [Clostridia bacterium]|nr:glycosyl hydrolase [Clostridia bacterium]
MDKISRIVLISLLLALTVSLFCGCIKIEDSHYENADAILINYAASDEATSLMNYLKSIYGKYVISGQYINEYEDFGLPQFRVDENDVNSPSTVFKANELSAVKSVTGDLPAMLGLDLSGVECGARCFSIEQALEWHMAGGIVTICWHWLVDNKDGNDRAFYTKDTNFNLKETLDNKDGERYASMIADIDAVSERLKILRDNQVPVLWRPLHEAAGGWFWWGASGENAYKELWDILYDRMTNYHNLNNLIWVYNGQDTKWYVGDDKCDIIGDDPYYNKGRKEYQKDDCNKSRFKTCYKTSSSKMIAMTENDFLPNIDSMFEQNVKWLTFCTWCREFVCVMQGDSNRVTTPQYAASYATAEELKEVYSDSRVITLSKLQSNGGYLK